MITDGYRINILLLAILLISPACNLETEVGEGPSKQGVPPENSASKSLSITTQNLEKSETKKNRPVNQEPKRSKVSKTQAISFDDIKFEMKTDDLFDRSMLTKKITDYEGKKIKIRGYILPSFKQDGLTQFVLVRDNLECCFGPGAALYDCVMVQMQSGKSASYSVRPVTVEGDFKIDEWEDFDGVIRAIYHLDGESVD
jgi:hypothetical protein